jgi:hypothetical protein
MGPHARGELGDTPMQLALLGRRGEQGAMI